MEAKRVIEPFKEDDQFDYFVINVKKDGLYGQFVFSKSVLIQKGIVSTAKKEGKRAFRVYPKNEVDLNKQAKQTQKWQLNYFYEINKSTDYNAIIELYNHE